jgi:hypothetical protein
LSATRPRYVPHSTGSGKWDDTDQNAITAHVLAGETVSGYLAYPYSFTIRVITGVYDAVNSIGTLCYGGASDAGGVDGHDFSAVFAACVDALASSGGFIMICKGAYTGNIVVDESKILVYGEGRGTVVTGNATLGVTTSRKDFLGLFNIDVVGTVSFVRVNQAWGDHIFTNNFISSGNWGASFGTILLQGGTGSIFLNQADAGSSEVNTCTSVKYLLIEDNLADTDIAVQNTTSNFLWIDNLHVESSTGFTNYINNASRMHVSNGNLYPFLKDDAAADAVVCSGQITGSLNIETGVLQGALTISGNRSDLYARIGAIYSSGSVTISGDDNIVRFATENTVDLTVSGDNNTFIGKWRSVFGALTNSGSHNNFDSLIWAQNAGGADSLYAFVNCGTEAATADGAHITHGLYGYWGYTPTITATGTEVDEIVAVNGIGETDFVVTIKQLNEDVSASNPDAPHHHHTAWSAGTAQTIYWMGRTFSR